MAKKKGLPVGGVDRRYRKPIERVRRPAEKTSLLAAVAAALTGVNLDGLSGSDQLWVAGLLLSVGLVPYLVSPFVDYLREKKENQRVAEELGARAVFALEELAGVDHPAPPDDGGGLDDDDGDDGSATAESIAKDLIGVLRKVAKARSVERDGPGRGQRTGHDKSQAEDRREDKEPSEAQDPANGGATQPRAERTVVGEGGRH